MARQAATDPVSGLANRRSLDQHLQLAIELTRRFHLALAVLIVDIDHLKIINDVSGHDAGDRAIRAVSDALRASCRAADFVARFGGDEFAVVALGTTVRQAVAFAERLREALRRFTGGSVTVSIGIADVTQIEQRNAASLLLAADKALYGAKSAGRNRVTLFAPEAVRPASANDECVALRHEARK